MAHFALNLTCCLLHFLLFKASAAVPFLHSHILKDQQTLVIGGSYDFCQAGGRPGTGKVKGLIQSLGVTTMLHVLPKLYFRPAIYRIGSLVIAIVW